MTGSIDASARYAQSGATAGSDTPPPAKPDSGEMIGKDAFLRLLVAQIRNQNPLEPADGIQFITQLAQFSELEQVIQIRQGVEALRDAARPAPDPEAAAGASQGAP